MMHSSSLAYRSYRRETSFSGREWYSFKKNVALWKRIAIQKRMDFIKEKHCFMEENGHLRKRIIVMEEMRIFYEQRNIPAQEKGSQLYFFNGKKARFVRRGRHECSIANYFKSELEIINVYSNHSSKYVKLINSFSLVFQMTS